MNQLVMKKEYNNAKKYIEIHECVNKYIEKNQELIELLEIQEGDIIKEEEIDKEEIKKLSDYEKYNVNKNMPHSLYESFKHKRPHAFEIEGNKIKIGTWKEMLIETSKYLYKKDPEILQSFLNDKNMNGKKRAYFSFDKKNLRDPKEIEGTGIYLETNLSANSIKQTIIKMLKKYNINIADYIVYFRADYSKLHQKNL